MAFNVGKKKGPMSEINVTPLVDVMLVLLVIFMITAPLMYNAIKLNLPKTKEVNRINPATRQVILSYTKSGEYFVGKQKLLLEELAMIIRQEFNETKSSVLFLRADYSVNYGKVARLMSYLKREGITQIALVTELEK